MAKPKQKRIAPPRSTATGLFVVCPEAVVDPEHRGVFVEVRVGPRATFVRCVCRSMWFLSPFSRWKASAKSEQDILAHSAWKMLVRANGELVHAT